ncbi:glycosyltransferase family 2 protein, partial [Halobacterium bonnevillei]
MESPRASIIVRCYNEADHLGKLLHGLAEQTLQEFEIILVDSGSTDGTIEIAESFAVDEVVYIDPEDFSFGRALNYGCEAASGEFCVIASAHVYPKRDDWLEQLLDMFEEDVALVYGKQRGNDVTTFSENQIFKQWFPAHDIERQDHPFCNNANAAIRRELWEEYPYDEQL